MSVSGSSQHRATLAATGSNRSPESSPMYHGYRQEIPAGYQVLSVVFVQAPREPQRSSQQGIALGVHQDGYRMHPALLLGRPGGDGQECLQEFEALGALEAAFLDHRGEYLVDGPKRPSFAVLPLDTSKTARLGRSAACECLVLLPLLTLPADVDAGYAPIRVLVDGAEVALTARAVAS